MTFSKQLRVSIRMGPLRWLVGAIALLLASEVHSQNTISLFNGSDLSGWTKLGGAGTFEVSDGVIIGRSAPNTPNTFLVTEATYSDYTLALDFWIEDPLFNSGVQIRSQSIPSHQSGRVFGYQIEIDPSPRAWTGGLFFEGSSPDRPAGWLDDLSDNQAAQQAFVLGEWNSFRIKVEGNRFQSWINDVQAIDFIDIDQDALITEGFIGLQVHSVGNTFDPKEVRFRNIMLSAAGTASPTDFNGDGHTDSADFAILMGNMHVSSQAPLPGDLTGDQLVDFEDLRHFKESLAEFSALNKKVSDDNIVASGELVPEPRSFALFLTGIIVIIAQPTTSRL